MLKLEHIEVVKNFPKAGINFYDIQSLLKQPEVWQDVIDDLLGRIQEEEVDIILGIESRGFLTGVPVAQILHKPFGMVRKQGKLPGDLISQEYALEYGTDTIEIQKDLIQPGMRVAIMDDLLATGGTMKATGDLVRKAGGEIALSCCVLELSDLGGREKLDFPFQTLLEVPLDPFSETAVA